MPKSENGMKAWFEELLNSFLKKLFTTSSLWIAGGAIAGLTSLPADKLESLSRPIYTVALAYIAARAVEGIAHAVCNWLVERERARSERRHCYVEKELWGC